MAPTDPRFTAQACGGDSSKNPVVTRPGLLALRQLGRNCYLHVWCVTGWPLRISGEGWAVPALDLCLWIEPFVLFPHTLLCVLGHRPSSPAPNAAAHSSCHAGSEGGHLLRVARSVSSLPRGGRVESVRLFCWL